MGTKFGSLLTILCSNINYHPNWGLPTKSKDELTHKFKGITIYHDWSLSLCLGCISNNGRWNPPLPKTCGIAITSKFQELEMEVWPLSMITTQTQLYYKTKLHEPS